MADRVKPVCPRCRQVVCTCVPQWQWTPGKQRYNAQAHKRKAEVVAQWVSLYGWVCPGYQVAPHDSRDLTADHVHPLSWGGDVLGEMTVLCRQCNSRRGLDTASQAWS